MSDARLSAKLFSDALNAKRKGNYAESLALYKKSIIVYPDDPDIMNTFYAIAKVLYLLEEYQLSAHSYSVYMSFMIVRAPEIVSDYEASSTDPNLSIKLFRNFRNAAHNVGQTLVACKEKNLTLFKDEILWYKTELSGKSPYQNPNLVKIKENYDKFDDECIQIGFKELLYIIDEHSKNLKESVNKYLNLANKILNILPD